YFLCLSCPAQAGHPVITEIVVRSAITGSSAFADDDNAAYRSTHIAMPMPPPMHSVARPFLASRALGALTFLSLSKAGRNLPTASSVVPCLGYSSASTTTSPLRLLIVT